MIFENKFELKDYTTISLLGQKGSGKTIGLEIIAEHLYQQKIRTITFDILGNITIHRSTRVLIKNDFLENEEITGKLINLINTKKAIVFDLHLLNKNNLIMFVDAICLFLLNRINKQTAILIDEASDILPSNASLQSEQVQRLWRVGRNMNIKPVILASQRPQMISKQVLALSDLFLLLRINYPLDLEIVRQITGEKHDSELLKNIKSFNTRQVLIYGYNISSLQTKFIHRTDYYAYQKYS